jgi:pseudouridylate synthase
LLAQRADAGTTVATTLLAAAAARIDVFATGGLGGVHDIPFDESADIVALARTSVITVCSGPKSLLDASATLERLETAGVPVIGWRSDRLAGFFTSYTDLSVPLRADDVADVVRTLQAARGLGLGAGLVVSNAVEDGLTPAALEAWLEEARAHAVRAGVRGREVTPFLLERLAQVSEGATVAVNLRLLEGNARLGARIALALARASTTRDGAAAPGGHP